MESLRAFFEQASVVAFDLLEERVGTFDLIQELGRFRAYWQLRDLCQHCILA